MHGTSKRKHRVRMWAKVGLYFGTPPWIKALASLQGIFRPQQKFQHVSVTRKEISEKVDPWLKVSCRFQSEFSRSCVQKSVEVWHGLKSWMMAPTVVSKYLPRCQPRWLTMESMAKVSNMNLSHGKLKVPRIMQTQSHSAERSQRSLYHGYKWHPSINVNKTESWSSDAIKCKVWSKTAKRGNTKSQVMASERLLKV